MSRYFEVKVTECGNCPEPYYDEAYSAYGCGHNDAISKEFKMFKQNKDQLTPSCPMWEQTKPENNNAA